MRGYNGARTDEAAETRWIDEECQPSSLTKDEQMAGDWAATTSPTLDLDDFMGIQFTTGPDGNLYQLSDQQFANLCRFRKD